MNRIRGRIIYSDTPKTSDAPAPKKPRASGASFGWSEAQDSYLRTFFLTESARDIAEAVGKSTNCVYQRAYKLGLAKRAGLSAAQRERHRQLGDLR